jgi:5,10-methylenetetrahydrofolate reductase
MARPSADARSTSTKRAPKLSAPAAVEAVADATAEIAAAEAAVVAEGATGIKDQQSQENLTRSAREAAAQTGTVQLARDADAFAFFHSSCRNVHVDASSLPM